VSKRWMPRSLDDVPDRLILFDGVCVLCCWRVRFVIERDASARFRFVAIQSTRGAALATRLAVDVASPETNIAIINGHAYFKSDAMSLVLAGLPGWSWSRIFLLLPRRVRDWAYDRIAHKPVSPVWPERKLSRPDIGDRPLVLCSTIHRGSSRDRSHPDRLRKASKRLCHSGRT
jgi:predicted DCC family thiol-disulfide oxidoreductase YuxK